MVDLQRQRHHSTIPRLLHQEPMLAREFFLFGFIFGFLIGRLNREGGGGNNRRTARGLVGGLRGVAYFLGVVVKAVIWIYIPVFYAVCEYYFVSLFAGEVIFGPLFTFYFKWRPVYFKLICFLCCFIYFYNIYTFSLSNFAYIL